MAVNTKPSVRVPLSADCWKGSERLCLRIKVATLFGVATIADPPSSDDDSEMLESVKLVSLWLRTSRWKRRFALMDANSTFEYLRAVSGPAMNELKSINAQSTVYICPESRISE